MSRREDELAEIGRQKTADEEAYKQANISDLLAEIKRLRSDNGALLDALLGGGANITILDSELKAQLAAKDEQIATLQKEAKGHLHDFNRMVEQLDRLNTRIRELEQLAIPERAKFLAAESAMNAGCKTNR